MSGPQHRTRLQREQEAPGSSRKAFLEEHAWRELPGASPLAGETAPYCTCATMATLVEVV